MKKILTIILLLFCFWGYAQNKQFGNGGFNLNGYYQYWLNGSDTSFVIRPMGVRLPLGTTAQRPVALTSTVRWNSDSTRLEIYNGTAWRGISFTGEYLSSVSIADAITSATANKVFYAGTGGRLQQSTKFSFDSTNIRLGIGRATPSQKIDIGDTSFTTTVVQNIGSEKAWNNSTSDATAQLISYNANTRLLGTSNYNISSGSITSFDITGYNSTLFHSGSGLCGGAVGLRLGIRTTSTGNITNGTGIYLNIRNTDTMTNYYGLYVGGNDATTTGWVNNYYALHLGITAATSGVDPANTWGLYAPNTLMNHYIAGNFGIGQTITTARLHLGAGTATASTAPLKFTSGTPTTTPEAGSIQYNNGLWIADSSNSVRDTIATRSWARNNISPTVTLASGTYTPTYTTGSGNIASASGANIMYYRIGNKVTVSGVIDLTVTSATTASNLVMTLPIASDLQNATELAGGATYTGSSVSENVPVFIIPDVTANSAQLKFYPSTTNAGQMSFTLTYLIR